MNVKADHVIAVQLNITPVAMTLYRCAAAYQGLPFEFADFASPFCYDVKHRKKGFLLRSILDHMISEALFRVLCPP